LIQNLLLYIEKEFYFPSVIFVQTLPYKVMMSLTVTHGIGNQKLLRSLK